jgi:hypothetical protein
VLKAITVYANKLTDATCTLTAQVFKTATTTGASTTLATLTNNTNAPGNINFDFNALNETVATDYVYWASVSSNDATPSGTDSVYPTAMIIAHP